VDASQLAGLHAPRPFPAVSLIMPTHRRLPERRQDQIRLKVLLDETRNRLRELELENRVVEELMGDLEKAAAQVDFDHTAEALVLLAARGREIHSFVLPYVDVVERVIIDDSFATRDLVAMLENTWKYRVLVLGRKTRLLEGEGLRIDEARNALFPMVYDEAVPLPEEKGRFSPREFPVEEERRMQFLRQIESNLLETLKQDPRPVVVVGVQRHVTSFLESIRPVLAESVMGSVEGSFDNATPAEIAAVVAPVLVEERERAQRRALDELDGARSSRRFAGGLEECWELAGTGRIRHLLVEEHYLAPARLQDGRLVEAGGGDGEGEFVNDAVDDLIEAVLRGDGAVSFVPDESLAESGRVAAILRY